MNLESLIFFAFVFLALGMIAGVTAARLLPGSKNEDAPTSSAQSTPVAPGQEVLRVSVDVDGGFLVIQARDGQTWRAPLIGMTGAIGATSQQQAPPALPADAAVAPPPAALPVQPAPLPTPAGAAPLEKPSIYSNLRSGLTGVLSGSFLGRGAQSAGGMPSIASQIDEVLQEKIRAQDFPGRGLRLIEMPDHGVGVFWDGTTYNDIESVPDDGVRQLIHSAVKDWQKRHS